MSPLQTLRHHVSGAIERGEKTAIVGQTVTHTDQIKALKLCVEAFTVRHMRSGLNSWDVEAFNAAKQAVKAAVNEWYADGRWQVIG